MEGDVRLPKRLHTMEETVNRKTDEFANYDVFISHRGPDTKTGFVGFLYKDLVAAGLQPFLDCKSIDIGDDSWKCIEHAIKRTPLAVVVFSESFAQSEWCLRELHVMLHTPSVKVLPVFYNVRPSEVRFPESGRLKDGFKKLASRHHHDNVIEQWRADLDQASKIMGWEHSAADRRLEVDLVKAIVGKVCELAQNPLPLDVGEYVVGVEQVAVEIMERLDEKKHVLVLGLWGMGGIGKSTLARELYNQMRNRFPAGCFIEDVTDKVSEAGGIVKLQNRILMGLCKNESGVIEDKSKGKVKLEERLSKTKVLLVLDDVHDEVGDNSGMYYWVFRKMLAQGSMCIVTSRDSRVFGKMNSFDINREVYIHNVQGLRSVDSMRMFSSFAFGGYWTVKQEFEELAENISKACGGVPLVVKVCGSLLKQEKNVKIWKEVLEKLNTGRIMDQRNIFDCLQISYNFLNRELQEMFLDIACALLGKPKDWAIRTWSHHHMSSTLGVRTLIEKALVTVNEFGCLSMHDHLRDMGREIARKKRIHEGVTRRLWMPESFTLLKRNEESLVNLQTLMVSNLHASDIDLDVSHMKNLCILICDSSINLVGQSLPKTLSWFDWAAKNDYEELFHRIAKKRNEVKILPKIPHVNNLVILNLKGSNIRALCASIGNASTLEVMNLKFTRRLYQLPDSFGGLKNLEDLNISWSSIESLPESFGELSNLDSLNMASCRGLTSLPHSFGRLQKLRHINLSGSGIQCLPESFGGLSNLEVLNVSSCEGLTSLPNSFGGLQKLRDIILWGSGIQSLPESFGELNNLDSLNMASCRGLTFLPDSFGRLQKLRDISIEDSGIQSLPESFGELSNLDSLNMASCRGLTSLPHSFGRLQKLRDIFLLGSGIQCLPESIGGLCNLEVLNVSLCRGLTSLPDSFGSLPKLCSLTIEDSGISCFPESVTQLKSLDLCKFYKYLIRLPHPCEHLRIQKKLNLVFLRVQSLPESYGELIQLEVLNLSSCRELMSLPHSFGSLKELRDINLSGSGIQSLPESFGELSNLDSLNMASCRGLTSLPHSFGRLQKLRDIILLGSGIQSLPESFGELINLDSLNMASCRGLTSLPDSFGRLQKLRHINLSGSGIQCFPESFGGLSNLEVLNMSTCQGLTSLPDSFGRLQKLRDIILSGSGIHCLPESFGLLSNLEVLNIRSCRELVSLPDSFGSLPKLRSLTIGDFKINYFPESITQLKSLDLCKFYMYLIRLPRPCEHLRIQKKLNLAFLRVQSLPESYGELIQLEVLNLSSCRELTSLPSSFGRLSNLEDLNLSSCRNLMSLPDSLGGLGNLRVLRLDRSGIECLPECFGSLSSLERLNMTQCRKLIKLPDSVGSLYNLRVLNLRCSTLIKILPSSFGGLSNLEELNLWSCENLNMLPDSFGSLRNLRTLTLGRTKIENLPESFGELSNLQELDLYYCSSLKALPQSITQLKNLQMLDLQDCPASPSFRPFQHRMPHNCVVKL